MTNVLEWKSLLKSYSEGYNGADQNESGLFHVTEASHLAETNLTPNYMVVMSQCLKFLHIFTNTQPSPI